MHANRFAAGAAFAGSILFAAPAAASLPNWTVAREIVGQTSTATVAAGGDPIYVAPKPAYSGAVGILIDYGADGAFVCSGSLINSRTVLTAAHCVTGTPVSTTVFFYGGADDPALYAAGSPADRIAVDGIRVNPLYTGEVVDENDIAILRLSDFAPSYAPRYELADLTDLAGEEHIIAGYGLRSISGGTDGTLPGFAAGTGRLRYAGNRFDVRLGDSDFDGFFEGFFGTAATDHVWLADFDNGTELRDGTCNLGSFFGLAGSKYCDLGIGAFEGIGAGGDSGSGYFVDGKVAAVHSFAWWLNDDESANRFGQLKGAVPVYYHLDFIAQNSVVPEPATWAMLIAGFGLTGFALRNRRAGVGGAVRRRRALAA